MKRGFYRKLAWSNIRKNYRFFIPRILAEAGLLGCFYIALTLAMDGRLARIKGGDYIPIFMWIGTAVLALLSAVLMFYTNSFLMKQRKREFGLYNVLGLEKKHVGRVLFHESMLSSAFSVIGGLFFGVLFYKLCSLLICRLLRSQIVIGFYFITPKTLLPAAGFFILLDLCTCLANRISVQRMNPVELIASSHTGEREPKVKWLMLIIGLVTLGAGYYISLTTQNPLDAMLLFFLAVILVIIGTYFLFVTGSVSVLKLLKKNRKYYYNKKHMPAVSGLLYRMKQNAVGLASIAILSTGVLVMISTTVSLYSGMEGSLGANYPQDLYVSAVCESPDGEPVSVPVETLESFARSAAEKQGLTISSLEKSEYLYVTYCLSGDRLLTIREAEDAGLRSEMYDHIATVLFISGETYEALTGKTLGLGKDEIAICRISSTLNNVRDLNSGLAVHGLRFSVKETLVSFPIKAQEAIVGGFSTYGIVLSDSDVLRTVYESQRAAYGKTASEMTGRIAVCFADSEAADQAGKALCDSIREDLSAYREENCPNGSFSYNINGVWDARKAMTGMYGSLLFLGILLGAVCLFAMVLIIYYKQISEGYEDRERFQIMEKIGMSRTEVKKTIDSQVLLVFFLPLATAGIHMLFAYPLLEKMLKVLALYMSTLFMTCTLITYAVFTLVYILIYTGTSRTYYKIVH